MNHLSMAANVKGFSVQYTARPSQDAEAWPGTPLHPNSFSRPRCLVGATAPPPARTMLWESDDDEQPTTLRTDLKFQRCHVDSESKVRQQDWVRDNAPRPLSAIDAKRSLQQLLVASIAYHRRHSSSYLHATIYATVGATRPESLTGVPTAYCGLHPVLTELLFRDFDLIIERGGSRLAFAAATEALPLWQLAPPPTGRCHAPAKGEAPPQRNPLSDLPKMDRI